VSKQNWGYVSGFWFKFFSYGLIVNAKAPAYEPQCPFHWVEVRFGEAISLHQCMH